MSTISTEGKSTTVASNRVRAGNRTYFFDVWVGPKGGVHMTISETAAKDGVFTRSRLVVFDHHVRDFYEGLCEAIRSMRDEQKKREAPVEAPVAKTATARAKKAA